MFQYQAGAVEVNISLEILDTLGDVVIGGNSDLFFQDEKMKNLGLGNTKEICNV